MNAAEASTLSNQGVDAAGVPSVTPQPTPTPTPNTPNVVDNALEEGGELKVSEKVQWLTLFIVGLTVVSLVLNIINNKKQMDKLEKEDADVTKKLKEHDLNLKKALGKKYESLDE
jgi:hypothetical protein